ncbi:MAG: type II toxin-antitoxin system VapC family toxin [Eubacterium sp.]|nr:type II toxin-antitoxin system VapC family toxin [Eubacterium sp.]
MYMLDTNIIIFCIRHPNTACAKKVASHLGRDLVISVVTYGELEFGILNSSRPEKNREAVKRFLAGISILDFDMNAAAHFGSVLAEMKQKNRYDVCRDRDKMIAAHARSRGDILVTNNTKDFSDIDNLSLEDWREPGDLSR